MYEHKKQTTSEKYPSTPAHIVGRHIERTMSTPVYGTGHPLPVFDYLIPPPPTIHHKNSATSRTRDIIPVNNDDSLGNHGDGVPLVP